ncbi:MAG TPA: penicillin acylase family protein, partial [Verrucomicrobiae bacterium]|nr:penicillin acylase family protein [Verrucomicrobiae bacterium]
MTDHPSEPSRRRFYRSPRARRRAVVGLVVAFIFVAVVTGLFYQTTLSGLAPESGVVKLAGLSAPVKVIRDAAGVPHIYAQNRLDLARALGYTQAQDRLFQIEMRRRLAEGRLAEVFGSDQIESDYVYRLFDPEKFARDSVAMYPPEMRAQLDAFVGGINAYIDAHQSSLEPAFRLVGIKPAHYTAEDLEAGALTIAMLLGYNATEESAYMNLAPKMAPSEIAALMPVYPTLRLEPPPPETTAVFGGAKLAFHLAPGFARLGHMGIPASNNWVVDGTMTMSGKPMLASDPHLPQSMP